MLQKRNMKEFKEDMDRYYLHTLQNEILLYVQEVLSIFCSNSRYRKGQDFSDIQYFHFSLRKSFQSLDSMWIFCTSRNKKKYVKNIFLTEGFTHPGPYQWQCQSQGENQRQVFSSVLTDKMTTFKAKNMQVKDEVKVSWRSNPNPKC